MTDYYYQATARDDPPEEVDDPPSTAAQSRLSRYPPEDEAYWAESRTPPPSESGEEPLWYEDRVRIAGEAPAETIVPAPPPRRPRLPMARWTAPDLTRPPDDEEPIDATWVALSPEPEPLPESLPEPEPEPVEQAWLPADPDPGQDAPAWSSHAEWPQDEPYPESGARNYVPGTTAAAGLAAAESGERRIRFDPTKERGAVYYDHAARHSRRVRLLKIALPTVAVISVGAFIAIMSFFSNQDDGLPALNLSGINVASREITMDKPHISGFDGTKRAYEVTAAKAIQELGNPKIVTLEQIEARFAVGEDVRAHVRAAAGTYDGNTQKLLLRGGIALTTTNGYQADLTEADVDIESGTIATNSGVKIRAKEGSVSADSMVVHNKGERIVLRGNVKVVYNPPDNPETADKPETAGPVNLPSSTVAPTVIEALPDGST